MDEETTTGYPTPEAMTYAQERLLLVAVRALMESHPDAAAFRESWAHCLSLVMRDHTRDMGSFPEALEETGEAFRRLQPVWESYFPDAPAARSKPGRR